MVCWKSAVFMISRLKLLCTLGCTTLFCALTHYCHFFVTMLPLYILPQARILRSILIGSEWMWIYIKSNFIKSTCMNVTEQYQHNRWQTSSCSTMEQAVADCSLMLHICATLLLYVLRTKFQQFHWVCLITYILLNGLHRSIIWR